MIGTEACDWRIVESTTGSAPWIRADRLGTQFFAYPGYFIGNNGPPAQPAGDCCWIHAKIPGAEAHSLPGSLSVPFSACFRRFRLPGSLSRHRRSRLVPTIYTNSVPPAGILAGPLSSRTDYIPPPSSTRINRNGKN